MKRNERGQANIINGQFIAKSYIRLNNDFILFVTTTNEGNKSEDHYYSEKQSNNAFFHDFLLNLNLFLFFSQRL